MSTRRRLLLALLSAVKWVVNRFTYIYNSIVPSGDYKKARLGKIEGNGEIVNQLINNLTETTLTTTSTSTTALTVQNYVFDTNSTHYSLIIIKVKSITSNCGIRVRYPIQKPYIYNAGIYAYITNSYSDTRLLLQYFSSDGESASVTLPDDYAKVIDLTKQFGTGNEPTSLTDNRIKRIIAKGYIPTNSGTYESSVVKEIEYSRLPDEYQEVEYLESTGTQYIDSGFSLSEKSNIVAKFSIIDIAEERNYIFGAYTNSTSRFQCSYSRPFVCAFGESTYNDNLPSIDTNVHIIVANKNGFYIDNVNVFTPSQGLQFTTGYSFLFARNNQGVVANLSKLRIYYFKLYDNNVLVRDFVPCYRKADNVAGLYDLVNNVFYTNQGTGTFAVGNDIPSNKLQLPQPIKLNGAINAHDTFEVLSDSYRFTRNVWNVDLGAPNWTKYTNGIFYSGTVSPYGVNVGNYNVATIMCPKYSPSSSARINEGTAPNLTIGFSNGINVWVRDDAYTDATTFKTAMSGVPLYYQLATPQVISIPKKHLGCVRLKDLSWTRNLHISSGIYYFSANLNSMKVATTKIYCNRYISKGSTGIGDASDKMITTGGTYALVYIRDDSYSTADDFLASLTDTDILFYETQNEVQDFTNSLDIQSGGFLNAKQLLDEVCEVLPNVELEMRK